VIPLRILHIFDPAAAAAVRAGPASLLPWLERQGHAVAHVALGEGGSFPACLGRRTGWWSWWRRDNRAAVAAAGAWGCDLVHAHGEAALAPGLDIAHGLAAQLVAEPGTLRESGTTRLLRDGSVAAVLMAGEEQRSTLLSDARVARDRVVVVPPGVDLLVPSPRSADGALVVASRLRRGTDAANLAASVATLRSAGLAVTAVVSLAPGVRLPAQEGIRVVPAGAELAEADVLVELAETDLPMHHVVDAMAAGRPVVAVAAGLLHEFVQDGRSGELVQPGDPRALAAALRQLAATEQRAGHAAAALQHARRHDINLVGEAVLGIYRAAIGGGAAVGVTSWKRLSTERLRRRTSGRQRTAT
jgi:hypothetical protein